MSRVTNRNEPSFFPNPLSSRQGFNQNGPVIVNGRGVTPFGAVSGNTFRPNRLAPNPAYIEPTPSRGISKPSPIVDYGSAPPPLNPSLGIARTLIFSGRSTNQSDSITGQGYINGYEGDDVITGSSRNDMIYGGMGNDRIISGGGSDQIFGGAGNDIIDMSRNTGVSTADGGSGRDTFIVGNGQGYTKIQGYNPREDRLDARSCGIGSLVSNLGQIEVISKQGDVIAYLQGSGYNLTGNLEVDRSNLGIMG